MPAIDRESGRRKHRLRPDLLGLETRWLLSVASESTPPSDSSLPSLPATPNPPSLNAVIVSTSGANGSAVDPAAPVGSVMSSGLVGLHPEASDLVVRVGQTVTNLMVGTASRAGQSLTYSLEPSDPPLSMLDTRTGAFSWTPTADLASVDGSPKLYRVQIRATENSPEAPFAIATFTVRVLPAGASEKAVADATAEANGGTTVDPISGALVAETQPRPRAAVRRAATDEKRARAIIQLAKRVPNPQVQARLLRRAARLVARAGTLA